MSRATEEQIELLRAHERWFVEAEDSTAVALRALLEERAELLKAFEVLEYEAKQSGGLLLHAEHNTGRRGLGLEHRSLRDAVAGAFSVNLPRHLRAAAVPKSEEKPK